MGGGKAPPGDRPCGQAAEAIREVVSHAAYDLYLGPEGDYLQLEGRTTPRADISVSCYGLPRGRFSVQICLGDDPLAIAFDDECDLDLLIQLCQRYLAPENSE